LKLSYAACRQTGQSGQTALPNNDIKKQNLKLPKTKKPATKVSGFVHLIALFFETIPDFFEGFW
tara:strand:+ start:54 stop:245 length:192 start_codon:yes stop_codon:yes gene_type:complete